ncbi:hypothetical protein [Halosimplex pelagicum]|uniref:Uncharacterized protein n=1 Tax=Halosimplex pelagicum TaxID=869886 RepID=A0A7D5TUE9_9EURY|nr:hypothetical protein [Halosimplex pelagicum]QLH82274.1 hypothetical protein HZS54_11915 [Halosimplex pelagicum]
MSSPLAGVARCFGAASNTLVHRGIVREASDYARSKIIRRVIGGFLLFVLTIVVFGFAWYVGSRGMEGASAVGIFTLMALLALITDENKWYFLSWLFDDAEYVYNIDR